MAVPQLPPRIRAKPTPNMVNPVMISLWPMIRDSAMTSSMRSLASSAVSSPITNDSSTSPAAVRSSMSSVPGCVSNTRVLGALSGASWWLMVTCPRETLTVTSRRSVLRKIDSRDLVVFADPAPLRIRASAIWKASL